jgi:hypothetical protein
VRIEGEIRELIVDEETIDHPSIAEQALHRRGHGDHVPPAVDHHERGCAAGFLGGVGTKGGGAGGVAGLGGRASVVTNQLGPLGEVCGVEEALHRHFHESRVGHVAQIVRVHQPLGLAEFEPADRIGRAVRRDVRVLQDAEPDQGGGPSGRRRRNADHPDAIGPA